MAKRYGRNQKRAARAEVAKLEARVFELQALLKHNRERTDRLEREANDIIHMFSEHSAFAPVKFKEDVYRNRRGQMLRMSPYVGPGVEAKVIELQVLRSAIIPEPTENAFAVHLILNEGHEWSYRFSGRIFEQALPPGAKREITHQLAVQMMEFVSKRWADKPKPTTSRGF